MKIIKSFLLVAAGLFANILLQAQELKTETAKPVASAVPPPGSKPVLAADMKPDAKNMPLKKSEDAAPAATPSALTRSENIKAPQEKPKLILSDDKEVTTRSLSADEMKTLNGTFERPKPADRPSNDQNAKPLPIAKPAVVKEQQNQ